MKIAIIGTGCVGTVAGACFAAAGTPVIRVGRDADPGIREPGLKELLERGLGSGALAFTTSVGEAVRECGIIFVTAATPSMESGEADLSHLREAVESIASAMDGHRIIVIKSTVPVGTHGRVTQWMRKLTSESFDIVSNPEFLREGCAVEDFRRPERVIIGTESEQAYETLKAMYEPFIRAGGGRILKMDPVSAELTKYACDAFLATRISFMNEFAQLCDRTGGDIERLREGMGLDSRIGPGFLNAGIGYGGSCIPKDIRALLHSAARNGVRLNVVEAVEEANRQQKEYLYRMIERRFGDDLSGMTFAVWGLSFKPGTDDIREAPALVLVSRLLDSGARVRAYDPMAAENVKKLMGERIGYAPGLYECLDGVNALVVATEWDEFRDADPAEMYRRMRDRIVFDGRNLLDPAAMMGAGLIYQGIGRGHESVSSVPVRLFSGAVPARKALSA